MSSKYHNEAIYKAENPKKYLEDEIPHSYLDISLIVFLSLLMCYIIYDYENMHIYVLKFFSNLGYQDIQYILGQHYYLGKGVLRDKKLAFYWFTQAAKQGHGHASFNLAVAHLQGYHRLERKGEALELLEYAASLGIQEAERLLKTACSKGECDY